MRNGYDRRASSPSTRTCCDGLGYKNIFGAYHPPIQTLTDRSFIRTLHHGWIRHGIAEIIKVAARLRSGSTPPESHAAEGA